MLNRLPPGAARRKPIAKSFANTIRIIATFSVVKNVLATRGVYYTRTNGYMQRHNTLCESTRHKMNNPIVEFLSQYIVLTKEEIAILSNQNVIRTYKKGTILLSEGEVAKECFFVLKGCVCSYYLVDGQVKVTEFFTEKQPITPVSYTTKEPSKYILECLEDSIISIGTPERNAELLRKLPRMAALGSSIMEDQLANQRMKYDEFIKLTPEERYQNLQKTSPELLNRVPQYLIASYLGIKPESLSRIRKRLFN